MNINILGIDIAKNVFQLHGLNHEGKAVYKKRCSRDQLLSVVARLQAGTIAMEACRRVQISLGPWQIVHRPDVRVQSYSYKSEKITSLTGWVHVQKRIADI